MTLPEKIAISTISSIVILTLTASLMKVFLNPTSEKQIVMTAVTARRLVLSNHGTHQRYKRLSKPCLKTAYGDGERE